MAGSPTVRRRRLALELRRLREEAALTIDEAAVAAHVSKSALSRYESSEVPVKPNTVRGLALAYGVSDVKTEALMILALEAGQRAWWQSYGSALSQQLAVYIGFEAEAASIRGYEQFVLPGLLQTRQYAEAIFKGRGESNRPDAEIEQRVAVRMKRQDRLNELKVQFIIEESALTRPIGGAAVMRDQVSRLVALSRKRNITLQVMPHDIGIHPGVDGSFSILGFADPKADPDLVYTETPAGELWPDKPEDISRMTRTFAELSTEALNSESSRKVLQRIIGSFDD
ncbi:helix-turn-helix transcriptional regulator [Dactylosporangium sp. NPDC049525]|uniref:helix-turn-helix domain-containing protein n=1 Tax=Dactylosporangium sp. NPDC049525 TaxID=3154730 RepID=UPI00344685E9